MQNNDWLKDELDKLGEDDFVILDCPGQVELYSHLPVMHDIAKLLTLWGFRVVSSYLLDSLFVLEPAKFISGCLLSLSCMLQLELPHVNIVTKCDMSDKTEVQRILDSESSWMINAMDVQSSGKLKKLTEAFSTVVDDYMMVSFVMLDITDEESIELVLSHTDHAVQYGEDIEPKEPQDAAMDEGEGEGEQYEPEYI